MEQKPSVFNFLDALQYLQSYYRFRKHAEPGFSYEAWASEMGFKSRSSLRMILYGQRKITGDFCQTFCRMNHLSEKERDYFTTLARYSQAATPLEKQTYGIKLIKILKTASPRTDIDNHIDFVTKPLYVRLLTMLGFEDLQATPENLANLLGKDIIEIQEALKKLQEMTLATPQFTEQGLIWKTTHQRFRVPDNMGSVPMMKFHEQSLLESIQAFHKPKEERRYKSLLLPLSEEELKEFNAQMDNFASEQLARFQSNNFQGRRLYQVNLNVHSITQELSPSEESPEIQNH